MSESRGEQQQTEVDLSGLMTLLSDDLYSSPDVAFRELVQNAHDSIERRRILGNRPDDQLPAESADERDDHLVPRISVTVGATITVSDNGSGLTRSEIDRFLATVGAGATRGLRENTESSELVGMFGLGFLSCFSIADRVSVTTTSIITPNETWVYESSDGFTYTVTAGHASPVGTTVELELKPSFSEYKKPELVTSTIRRYCQLLRHPIVVNNARINLRAPWRSSRSTDEELTYFANEFDPWFSPLAVVPIGSSAPGSTGEKKTLSPLSGLLWIQDGSTYGNADNRRLSVYVRGMHLTDNEPDLLPRWAGFVSGVVESDSLAPTASRESLQKNSDFTEAQMVIAEDLVQGLVGLAREHPARWRDVLTHHSQALISAAVADERLFDLLADEIRVPTSNGSMRVRDLAAGRHLHVSTGSERGFEELLFLARRVPVARGNFLGVLPFLRRYAERFSLIVVEVGSDEGNSILVDKVELPGDDVEWLNDELGDADSLVIPARFDPPELPLIVFADRAAELKRKIESDETAELAGSSVAGLARIHTDKIANDRIRLVYVNLSCPTIERLLATRDHNPAGAFQATALLRTLKTLMVATDAERGGAVDITGAFTDALMVIDGLLMAGPAAKDSEQ